MCQNSNTYLIISGLEVDLNTLAVDIENLTSYGNKMIKIGLDAEKRIPKWHSKNNKSKQNSVASKCVWTDIQKIFFS